MALIRDINSLTPAARDAAEKGLAILKARGIRFFVNETLRTRATQEAYHAQGRQPLAQVNALRSAAGLWPLTPAENKKTITDTLISKHMSGRAIDICPADLDGNPRWKAPQAEWEAIAVVMKSVGFEWGGDWNRPRAGVMGWDAPHYQLKEAA